MAAVELRGIRKSFGATEVVRGIDLAIASGELLTLVGPSGCGKSTVLRMLAGLEPPTEGSILIDGRDVTELAPKERGVAMVFQSYALYPHMTVERNIGFPLEIARVTRTERARRVREIAARVGIAELLGRLPRELSGGQRQRVALGRALVRGPRLCLFDEPLSNLDAALRAHMRLEIKKLHEQLGATFVYVTHDQVEAMTLSDRVVVLDRGVIRQVGTPREVYDRPLDTFVARFIGSPEINLVVPERLGFEPRAGRIAGVRPEDVSVAPAEDGPWRIYAIEPVGSVTWVTIESGETRIVGSAPRDFGGAAGDTVRIATDRDRVLWFDERTGRRVEP